MAMGVLAEEVVLAMDTLAKDAMAKDAIAQHLGMRRESGSTTTPARRSGQSSSGARRRPPAEIDKYKNCRYTVNFHF